MKNDPKKQKRVGHIPYFLYYASVASYFEGGNSYREWAKMLENILFVNRRAKVNGALITRRHSAF